MAANFQKIIVAVSTLLSSLGIYILNGFDEELDDRFNDMHIKLWSVTKALLLENDYFLNCTVLESLLDNGSYTRVQIRFLRWGIIVPKFSISRVWGYNLFVSINRF